MAPIITPVARDYIGDEARHEQQMAEMGQGIGRAVQYGEALRQEMKKGNFINTLLGDLHKRHPEEQFTLPQGTTREEAVALTKHLEYGYKYKKQLEDDLGLTDKKIQLPSPKLGMSFKETKDFYDGMTESYKMKAKGEGNIIAATGTEEDIKNMTPAQATGVGGVLEKRVATLNQQDKDQEAIQKVDAAIAARKATGKKFWRRDIAADVGAEVATSPKVAAYIEKTIPPEPTPMTPQQGIQNTGDAIKDARDYGDKRMKAYISGKEADSPLTNDDRITAYVEGRLWKEAAATKPATKADAMDYVERQMAKHGDSIKAQGAARLMLDDIAPNEFMTKDQFDQEVQKRLPDYSTWIQTSEQFYKLVSGIMNDKQFKIQEPTTWQKSMQFWNKIKDAVSSGAHTHIVQPVGAQPGAAPDGGGPAPAPKADRLGIRSK